MPIRQLHHTFISLSINIRMLESCFVAYFQISVICKRNSFRVEISKLVRNLSMNATLVELFSQTEVKAASGLSCQRLLEALVV